MAVKKKTKQAKAKQDEEIEDPENPFWTDKDFARARPFPEVFPQLYASWLRTRGRPPKDKASVKVPVTLRLDPDVLAALRATGPGWQTRTNEILARWAKRQAAKQ